MTTSGERAEPLGANGVSQVCTLSKRTPAARTTGAEEMTQHALRYGSMIAFIALWWLAYGYIGGIVRQFR